MKSFANVWDALTDSPEEAAVMTARSELMIATEQVVASWKLNRAEAARRLGISPSRLNDLMKGKIDKFSVEALLILAHKAGLKVEIRIAA